DMAEIPAYQEIAAIDGNRNGVLDPEERDAYLGRKPGELARNLSLTVDGTVLPLAPRAQGLELPPGAGGLPTLRLEVFLTAPLPERPGAVEFRDRNFAGRAGWQEVVADAGEGLVLADSSVPRVDRSQALGAYPADLLQSPPQVSEARFRVTTGSAAPLAPATPAGALVGAKRFGDRMTELIDTTEPLGPGLVLTSLLVAALLGALHALGWRSLCALGVSGGLLPCPSALVVMLAAISLGRIGFGLVLIVAFSAGLAGVLGAIGLVFVYARSWFARLPVNGRFARYVPVASALVISAAGLLIV